MERDLRSLGGELESYPVLELVPLLAERRATGLLTLERGALRRSFDLSKGAVVRASSSEPREYLGQMMVDYGMVSSHEAASAFWDQEAKRVLLGKVLPMRGALDEPRVREALLLKIRESLLDCYRWTHGTYRFEPGEVAEARGLEVAVRLSELHREALHRAREWRRFRGLFPSPEAKLLAVDGKHGHAIQPDEEIIVELAREGLTVRKALDAFRDGEYRAYRRLAGLVDKGFLEVVPAQDVPPSDRELARDRLELAKRLLAIGRPAEAVTLATLASAGMPSRVASVVLRDARVELALRLADELLSAEGVPHVGPDAHELDRLDLPPAERYLLLRIDQTHNLRQTVREAPMGELEALRILQRFVEEGILVFREEVPEKRAVAK